VQLTLPIYYTQTFKTKKDKTFLVGLNWYRNSHYILSNNVKCYYHQLISEQLNGETFKIPLMNYDLFYKTTACDMMNVVTCIDKFVMDALQSYDVIENDNVKFYKTMPTGVAVQDKDNPRVEITVREDV